MGGGDLNLKKSWHPQTLKNQEKVWKAQQADLREKQKLNELEREIKEERNREDLKKLGQSSGVLLNNDNPKLEWMYKGPSDLLNREEYLLGRAIDKNFEQLDAAEKTEKEKDIVGVTVPKNHVEHECIPFSIRQYKSVQSAEQVDLQRKIMEDPLMLIKQKEMESRRKILENPVKLKELHRLLKLESINKRNKKKEKKKKAKKGTKKSKSRHKSSDSDSTSDDEKLDQLLTKQYTKVKKSLQKEEKAANLDFSKMVHLKYEKLSKELDKLLKTEKKRQRTQRDSSSSGSSSSSSEDRSDKCNHKKKDHTSSSAKRIKSRYRSKTGNKKKGRESESCNDGSSSYDEEELDNLLTKQYMKVQDVLQKERSTAKSDYNEFSNLNYEAMSKELDRLAKSERNRQQKERSNSTSSDSSQQSLKRKPRCKEYSKSNNRFNREQWRSPKRYHPKNKETRRSRSGSRSKDRESGRYSRSDKREYNPTSSDRKKIENSKTHTEALKKNIDAGPNHQRPHSSKQIFDKGVKKLSEEEKEKRRREMMENATWREEERAKTVKKYRDEYDKEKQIYESSEFDKMFISKELQKAMSNQNSVESRIKSNINNIQRSSRAMDTNFAKR